MKAMRLEKNLKIVFITLVAINLIGCSKGEKPSSKPHKIIFKAEVSAGSSLNQATYGYDATLTTVSSLGGTTWTSPEVTVPADATVATISTNAMGTNTSSTLKVQVFVDGVLKKESTGSGIALSAVAQYNLR